MAVVGDTRDEVERLVRAAVPLHLEGLRAAGLPVTEPHKAAGVAAA